VDVVFPASRLQRVGRELPPDGSGVRAVDDHRSVVARVREELLDQIRLVAGRAVVVDEVQVVDDP